ncbi:MAG: 3'-5' exonuclease [Gammaproteobacteria bacterium]|nr:3'-5' exonuclease [Gammaproteobacteria bacterium]MDH3766861.1 3'-5' exonuclease [Gammaproteobacteria bacterium]
MKRQELEELAQKLDEDTDFRVLRRLRAVQRYHPDPDDTSTLRRGLYVDVETTGLDPASDAIIQLALTPFDFSVTGLVCSVRDGYEAFDDPGRPIPDEITRLTGISDDDVRGHTIDWQRVEKMVQEADLIVAHNAGFDRRFVEARCKSFEHKGWACSMLEIPWRDEGLESSKQEYLAYRFGFFYSAHSAGADTLAGIHLLAQKLPSGDTALLALLDSARRTTYRLWAVNSPFEAKTLLKARGYRWNGGEDGRHRAWYLDSDKERCEIEQEFLRKEIYKRDIQLPIDKITCFTRYSDRI